MYATEKHIHEAHIPDLVQALQLNVAGIIYLYGPKRAYSSKTG